MNLANKEESAMNLIRKYADEFDRVFVLFSGGRDSLVTLHLVMRALGKSFKVVYTRLPGNTAPECDNYVFNICKRWRLKLIVAYLDYNFWKKLKEAGFPYIAKGTTRWCKDEFKYKVWKKLGGYQTLFITGVKRSDRKVREITIKPLQFVERWKAFSLAPIFNWTKQDILNYISKHNLTVNPLYNEIGHSGNCIWCPYLNKASFIKTMKKYWNISTILFEVAFFEIPQSLHKNNVRGSSQTYERLRRYLSYIEELSIKQESIDRYFNNIIDECIDISKPEEIIYWSFHEECIDGIGKIMVKEYDLGTPGRTGKEKKGMLEDECKTIDRKGRSTEDTA